MLLRRDIRSRLTLLAGIAMLLPCYANAEIDWATETLTGDWSGKRTAWTQRGVSAEALIKGTAWSNLSGGIRRETGYMQNTEFKLELDTGKLWNIPDSSIYLHAILNSGSKFNANAVGSLMGVDNSEVADNNLKLYQAWFNKNLFNERLSLLAGVYPVDTEFYVTDSSGLFLHPSLGMGAEPAQSGAHGPSIYPYSSLGVRAKLQLPSLFYLQAAVVNGDPGDGRHQHWYESRPFNEDGSLSVVEFGYRPGEAHHIEGEGITPGNPGIMTTVQKLEERYEPVGKYAIGFWGYSRQSDALLDTQADGTAERHRNQGGYLLMEQTLFRSQNMERDVAAFFRYGHAKSSLNTFERSWSLGLRVRGLLPGRYDDFFGIAATRAEAGGDFLRAERVNGSDPDEYEQMIEMTYRALVRPWLAIQPSLQHIRNPGLDPELDDSTVLGLRFEMTL